MRPGEDKNRGQRVLREGLVLAEGHPRAGLGGNFGENGPRIGGSSWICLDDSLAGRDKPSSLNSRWPYIRAMIRMNELRVLEK